MPCEAMIGAGQVGRKIKRLRQAGVGAMTGKEAGQNGIEAGKQGSERTPGGF